MDDLVLLAQVHGSGPATLETLRANGIQTVRDVAALDPEELARIGGLTAAAARRMSAEARRVVGESSIGSDKDEAVPGRAITAGKRSAITVVERPRRKQPDVQAGVRGATGQGTERARHAHAPTDDGVSPDEASVLSRGPRPVSPGAKADDPALWLPSFFRFG